MTLLGRVVRNGRVEAEHHGAVAVVDVHGEVVAQSGDITRRFYGRSALKPFQALVSQMAGARLDREALSVACASHGGFPVHIAYVRSMLDAVGLDESYLQTPPAWPIGQGEEVRLVANGTTEPSPILHNCSGKHAAMLRACVASGWPLDNYLDPDHPLQEAVAQLVVEVTGDVPGRVGVDGCGAPVFEVSAVGLARAFARLGSEGRFEQIWWAMHRYPALASENPRIDQEIGTWLDAAAKVGAEGSIGVALRNRGGIGVKCWDGSARGLRAGIVGTMEQLGLLVGSQRRHLAEPEAVFGGGEVQGAVEPMVELS
ncbi:MAG: asparaginase [Acidimicrobiia bacterium]|nr:asparaginase [Acidimicrobiia bacterium]